MRGRIKKAGGSPPRETPKEEKLGKRVSYHTKRYTDWAGESRTKLRTSKLRMVTQERGEKKQGRDFSLGLKITR